MERKNPIWTALSISFLSFKKYSFCKEMILDLADLLDTTLYLFKFSIILCHVIREKKIVINIGHECKENLRNDISPETLRKLKWLPGLL